MFDKRCEVVSTFFLLVTKLTCVCRIYSSIKIKLILSFCHTLGKWNCIRFFANVLGRMSSQDDLDDDASSVYMSHTGKNHAFDDESNDYSD